MRRKIYVLVTSCALAFGLSAQGAVANQANTVNAHPDAGNGTATCTGTNSNSQNCTWYLSGNCAYTSWVNPDMTNSYNFDPNGYAENSIWTQGPGYIDAFAQVTYVVFQYNPNTQEQRELDSFSGSFFQIPVNGGEELEHGRGTFTALLGWRVRYKVRGGGGGAWTGDL